MHISRVRRRRLAVAASIGVLSVAAGFASQASAQTTAGANDTIGEVVVTAQFREQNVQQTPIAITAVSGRMLESRSQTSIEQVANQAPNVTLKPATVGFGPSLTASIRGVGQYDFSPALEPGVGMYVDDVYYSTLTGSIFDLLDLDRVEILRGPQGTLAGKNSIGGAVKLYSKKPSAEEGGYLQGTYGALNRIEVRGGADFVVVPEKLFVRISGVTKHYDGYVTRLDYGCANPGSGVPTLVLSGDCQLGKEGGKSYSAVRGALRWMAAENIEVNLIGDFTSDNSENPATTLVYARTPNDPKFIPANPYVSYSTYFDPGGVIFDPFAPGFSRTKDPFIAPSTTHYRGWGISGTIDWRLNEKVSVKSITALRAYTSRWGEDNDASPLNLDTAAEKLTHRQFSQELRLNGSLLGDAVDFTLGGFYFRQLTTYATHQDLPSAGDFFDFLSNDPVLAHTEAGFAHAVWHVTDRLNLTGGIRYTAEDKDYTFIRLNRDGTPFVLFNLPPTPLNGKVGHYEGSNWDYRADVDYRWTPDFMTYAEFSTGFKGGGVNPRPYTTLQVLPFNKETLQAYEIGFKSSLLDRRLRLNAAAFYNKYKDIQLTLLSCPFVDPTAAGCALPANAGDATVKGAEAEAELHPLAGLELDGSVSYLDFEYTRINPFAGGPTQPAGVQIGMVSPYTPKWKWSLGVQYEIPVGAAGSLTPRVDASYQSEIFTNAVNCGPISPGCVVANSNRVPGYTLVNARLTWKSAKGDWQAALEVTNVTNKLYYNTLFDLMNFDGSVLGQPGMPREWAVSLKKSF